MKNYLRLCRQHFFHIGLFSLFVNVLTLTTSIYMLQVYDRVFSSRSGETLVMLTIVAIGGLLVMMALDILRSRLLLGVGMMLDAALGPTVLKAVLERSAGPSANHQAGSLRDVGALRGYLGGNGVISLFDAPWLPFYVFVIYMFHPLLGLTALGAALMLLLLAWANEKFTRKLLEETTALTRRAASFIDGGVRNAEIISALGMLPAVTARWSKLNNAVIATQMAAGRRSGIATGISKFARMLVQVGMMGLGGWLVIHQELSGGGMIATTIILARALAPVEALIGAWKGFVEARASYIRLDQMLKQLPPETVPLELPAPKGALTVERIVMVTGTENRQILKGVSFSLASGDSLGVIGPSAAGKSTLSRILTGAWKPTAGVVRLDGADILTWEKSVLGRYLGYLPQDVELFPGTVAENIARLGDARPDEVVKAGQRAFVHDMILRLPKGYDTEVGEGAVFLSAGQRQRIGLARALYGSPKLIVLDEPNASLDGEGEEALMSSLAHLKAEGVTVIIVSHKPSVLSQVDKMLVLREGQVEAFGSRQEVMGRFSKPQELRIAESKNHG
jgi:PrtD family type I secretion system ABC transporter